MLCPRNYVQLSFTFELLTDLFARIVNAGTKIWGGFDLKEANACAAVSKTSVPVLIIHGDKDKTAPVSMAYKRAVFAKDVGV